MTTEGGLPAADDGVAPIGRTLGLAGPAFWPLTVTVLLGAGAIAADIGLVGTAAWLISRASQHPNESHLAVAIVAVQVFGLSRGLLRYEERLVGHSAAFRLLASMRVKVYQRLEALAPTGLPAFRRGDLLARMVQDIDSLQDLVVRVIPPFGSAALAGSVTVVLMWWMLPAAGAILAVCLVLAATVVPWLTGSLARRREARFARVRGELTDAMVDLTEGAAELIAFGAVGAQTDTVEGHDAELTIIASATAGTAGIGQAVTTLLAGLSCWGCLVVGIPAVASGRLDGTQLAVITLIPLAAFELVLGMPVAAQALQRVRQAAARVFEVTEASAPVADPDVATDLPAGPYDLQARSVCARYPGAGSPALRGVDLSIPPGHRVAVIGPSGAGKSTLAAVLVRFLSLESGSVSLGGTPLDRMTGDDVRTVIGLVGQDPYLFDTTIAENLRIGHHDATDDELEQVLVTVGLGDWFGELPCGLATEVGRRGGRLSGGQSQRIAVARALLAGFPVLLLDEPAEHLDPVAADSLTADLLDVTDGQSVLLITHRLAGLECVDEILVVESGQVVERGTHDALLSEEGNYSRLWWDEMSTARHVEADTDSAGSAKKRQLEPTAPVLQGGRNDGSPER